MDQSFISASDFESKTKLEIYLNDRVGKIYATSKYVTPKIDIYFDFSRYNEVELKETILHELLHIYEIYSRIKSGVRSDLEWSINNILFEIRNNYNDKFIDELWYLIYLSFNHEINARVCGTYINLMDSLNLDKKIIDDKLNNMDLSIHEFISQDRSLLIQKLKKTSAWKYKDMLSSYSFIDKKIDYEQLTKFLRELNVEIRLKYNINNRVFRVPS